MTRYALVVFGMALLLTGCGPEQKDYGAMDYCQDMGYKPGTKEFDKCVSEEKSIELMNRQQQYMDAVEQQQQNGYMYRR